jgi:cell division septum initiation protein DivIVA
MPLRPDEIDPELLPRASVGGFKPGPVAELLKRIAWDYRQLLHDNQQLHERLAELQDHAEELARQLEAQQSRKSPDELARQTLAASQRAARELRESTRLECEAALKKARMRAKQIEQEHARAVAALRELQDLRRTMQERLRSLLTAALEHADDSQSTATPEPDLGAQLNAGESSLRARRQRQGQTQRA